MNFSTRNLAGLLSTLACASLLLLPLFFRSKIIQPQTSVRMVPLQAQLAALEQWPKVSAAHRNFLYRGANACYNFDSDHFRNATACPHSAIPGAYLGAGGVSARPKGGQQLYNSAAVQRFLYQHQNPVDCRNAKFIVANFSNQGHGIGSAIHVMSYGLTRALILNRVYVLATGGEVWTQTNSLCTAGKRWDQCIFMPFSQCTLEEITDGLTDIPFFHTIDPSRWDEYRVLRMMDQPFEMFPPRMAEFLEGGPIPAPGVDGPRYSHPECSSNAQHNSTQWAVQWWRAQATAYLLRFNPYFKAALEEQKKKIFPKMSIPPGTIGVHIRRGDKGKESPDVDDAGYMRQVEAVYAAAGGKLSKTIFLSTEDSESVKFFQAQAGWTVLMTNVSRYHSTTTSPIDFAVANGMATVVLNDFVSLDLALQCDAWVGLVSSNWVRLIHEIRSVNRCKADNLFYDSRHGDLWGKETFIGLPSLYR